MPVEALTAVPPLVDRHRRRYRKLRISVTDRCPFRCHYCMPDGPSAGWLPKSEILSFEEITRFTAAVAAAGIREVRLTGGEPLVRRNLANLVAQLKALPGIDRVALTTNGTALPEHMAALAAAGLDGVTISIDSLEPDTFHRLTGGGELARVLAGIEAAADSAVPSKKLNAVVVDGVNDTELCDLIRFGHRYGFETRFIEYMPFGNRWAPGGVLAMAEMLRRIEAELGDIIPVPVPHGSTSRRFTTAAPPQLRFGIIPTVSETLCDECDRLRLTADGRVLNCLFDATGHSVKAAVRDGSVDQIRAAVQTHLDRKGIGYLAERQTAEFVPLSHMYRVGG